MDEAPVAPAMLVTVVQVSATVADGDKHRVNRDLIVIVPQQAADFKPWTTPGSRRK